MPEFEDHITPLRSLSPALMQAYLAGELSPRMQHEVEKYLLDHPFEAEAMEGYETDPTELSNVDALDVQLNTRIQQAEEKDIKKIIPIWKQYLPYAASFILLLVATVTAVYFYGGTGAAIEISLRETDAVPLQDENETIPTLPIADSTANTIASVPAEEQPTNANKQPTQKPNDTQPLAKKLEVADNQSPTTIEKVLSRETSFEEVETLDMAMSELEDVVEEKVLKEQEGVAGRSSKSAKKAFDSSMASQEALRPVVVDQKEVLIASSGSKTITGLVTDADSGEGLPGVTILIKNSNEGVNTDVDGKFNIEVKKEDVLQIFYIGMQSKEVKITDFSELTITLTTDVQQLSEVVVTSYGEETLETSFIRAQPINGNKAYQAYLQKQIQYPNSAINKRLEGTVKLKVTITADGEIGAIKVVKSLSAACDDEAIRLVKEGAAWYPALKNNKPIDSEVKLKVKFKFKN